jgi:hypothetical protein
MIQKSPDLQKISRSVFSSLDYLGEIGGIYMAVRSIGIFLLVIMEPWSWRKYLIKRLYRHQTSIKAGTLKSVTLSQREEIFQKAIQTLKTRKPIYPEPNSMLREWLQLSLSKFKWIFPFTANDWFYLKA